MGFKPGIVIVEMYEDGTARIGGANPLSTEPLSEEEQTQLVAQAAQEISVSLFQRNNNILLKRRVRRFVKNLEDSRGL